MEALLGRFHSTQRRSQVQVRSCSKAVGTFRSHHLVVPTTPLSISSPDPPQIMTEEIRADSYVGFDSITNQIEHKLLKRGFQFNVMVVGESCKNSELIVHY